MPASPVHPLLRKNAIGRSLAHARRLSASAQGLPSEPLSPEPKISFCTTCMGRRHQLAEVYRQNIDHASSYQNVEFVLLDYASPDGLRDWVESELAEPRARGTVRYFRTDAPEQFHMAHAKNAAHRLASGEILVNLDADNRFEPGFAEEVARLFAGPERVIAGFGRYRRGCMGRIAIRRSDFFSLGGYDEELCGWGYEDADLARRALRFGLVARRFDDRHAVALQHTDEERMRFTMAGDKRKQHRANELRSKANLAAGRIVANAGRSWGEVPLVGAP